MKGFLNVVMWKSAAALAVAAIALLLPGQALAQSGEVIEYIHTDALGSPVAVTNAAGQVIETTVYEPYGGVVNRPLSDGPGYTGHVTDASTGLSYMQQRYYDPEVGVFLSVDPVTAHQQPVGQFNRYRYGNGSPYVFTDPDGRQASPQALMRVLNSGAAKYEARRREFNRAAGEVASSVADGDGTIQIGVVTGGSAGGGAKTGAGVAIDGNGSLATYTEVGVLVGPKADVNAGITVQITTAKSVLDLDGVSLDASVGAGAAVGGSADMSVARARDGSPVVGVGVTAGAAAGAGGAAGPAVTKVQPILTRKESK